jgi:hypothetical protein
MLRRDTVNLRACAERWPSPRWSSSCVGSSGRAGDATAGKIVLPDVRDLLAEPLEL